MHRENVLRGGVRKHCIHASCKCRNLACAHRMPCIRAGIDMRTLLLLSTMLLAVATFDGHAQSRGAATVEAAHGSAAPAPAEPKSAFGRVMGVLIAKLVQDTQAAQQRTSTSDRGATTLPIDVEVGAAFQPAASATAAIGIPADAAGATQGVKGQGVDVQEVEAPARVPELALQGAPAVAGQ